MATTLAIPLKDIVIDAERTIDLASLPEDEAITLIKKAYGALSASIEVTIKGDIAYITLPEEQAHRATEALKTFERALRAAQRGEYARAIPLFQQVLQALPAHVDARRNLAMAYLESGDKEQAIDHLLQALMLDPRDAWSYVLLGNIYAKHENDPARAENLYRRAMEINPHDAILLTNYGALMMTRGNPEQAEEFFERAIQADPLYPNPYHARALLSLDEGRPADAVASLDDLFTKARTTDIRSGPLYAEARRLYLQANQRLAAASVTQMMDHVEQTRLALEQAGNIPIRIRQDDSLTVDATAQLAWRYARGYHLLKYRNKSPSITPHLLAHELEHLALELDARAAGRNRFFASTASNRDYAIRSVAGDTTRLKSAGIPDDKIAEYIRFVVNGLALQLYNMPLDMTVEQRLFDHHKPLHSSQFVYLHAMLQENLRALEDTRIRTTSPREIWRANVTLNCAMALFVDHLYAGRTAYAEPYRQHTIFDTGQRLFRLWQDATRDFHPGDEYDLVDEYAQVLRLQRWYEWTTEMAAWTELQQDDEPEPAREGTTNPQLLKQLEPAAIMHCLGALQRFDAMPDDQVRSIAFEIAVLGRAGLDYADPDPKYTLNSIPGERFSGLQLMCLMHVGFKRIDPTLDTGMDLEAAYHTALDLHRGKT